MIDRFPATCSSLLRALSSGDRDARLLALGSFYERYCQGLRHVLQAAVGLQPQDADSVVHDFFIERLLNGHVAEKYLECLQSPVGPQRKFRQYLVRSIRNFAVDWLRKRRPAVNLDELSPRLVAVEDDLERVFNLEWLQELLANAFRLTREHYLSKGSGLPWELFLKRHIEPLLTGTSPPSYDDLARYYSFEDAKQASSVVTNVLRTFKGKWRQLLRDEFGPLDDASLGELLSEAYNSVEMARYLDARRLLINVISSGDKSPAGPRALGSEEFTGLLALAENDFTRLLPAEQVALYGSYLSMPISGLLSPEDVHTSTNGTDAPDTYADVSGLTFASILADEAPSCEVIRRVKEGLTKLIKDQNAPIPTQIVGVLRLTAIAIARTRCGSDISSVRVEKLRRSVEAVIRQPWLDEATQNVLREYFESTAPS
jgi:DNA-directed RNA polymerase specialized sigma24 family protein